MRQRSSQCKAFVEGVARLIKRLGGRGQPNDPAQMLFDSKYGRLRLHLIEETTGGPGDVMGRFDFPRLAAGATGCHPLTGKWNHHYPSPRTAEEAIAEVERWLTEIRPTSLNNLYAATSLVPAMISLGVIDERCGQSGMRDPLYALANGHDFDHDEALSWFTRHVEYRSVLLFDTNARLREALMRESGRGVLYALVDHWLDAYLHDPLEYRKRFPLISDEGALKWSRGSMP